MSAKIETCMSSLNSATMETKKNKFLKNKEGLNSKKPENCNS